MTEDTSGRFARNKAIAAAVQTKTHATARTHPGEDRISIKGKDGVWRDYTGDEAVKGFHLKAFKKDPTAPAEPEAEGKKPLDKPLNGPVGRLNQPKHEDRVKPGGVRAPRTTARVARPKRGKAK